MKKKRRAQVDSNSQQQSRDKFLREALFERLDSYIEKAKELESRQDRDAIRLKNAIYGGVRAAMIGTGPIKWEPLVCEGRSTSLDSMENYFSSGHNTVVSLAQVIRKSVESGDILWAVLMAFSLGEFHWDMDHMKQRLAIRDGSIIRKGRSAGGRARAENLNKDTLDIRKKYEELKKRFPEKSDSFVIQRTRQSCRNERWKDGQPSVSTVRRALKKL